MTKIITVAIVVVLGLGVGFYILHARSAGDGTLGESVAELSCGDHGVCAATLGSAGKDRHHADLDHCPGQGDDADTHSDCACNGDPSACTDDMKASCEEAESCGDDADGCTPDVRDACEQDKSSDGEHDACAGNMETCCKRTKGSGDSY
jgi:hypothetical protein